MKQERCLFTLIELLVTIAIIAILAGMLLPALNMARESARKITCTSHLKAIGTCSMLYRQDFGDSIMPPVLTDVQSEPGHLYAQLYHWPYYYGRYYLKGRLNSYQQCPGSGDTGVWKTFRCPSDPKQKSNGRSYATYRYWLFPAYGNAGVSRQKQPSSQYLISEFDYFNFFNNTVAQNSWKDPDINNFSASNGEIFFNDSQSMGPNHSNAANILYLDSHVATRSGWCDRPVRKYWGGSYSPKDQ